MVVFEGTLTGTAKKYYNKKVIMNLMEFFMMCVALIPFTMYIVVILLEDSFTDDVLLRAILWTPSYVIVFTVVHLLKLKYGCPKKIEINADYISVETQKEVITRTLSDVRSIYDYGEFYQIRVESKKMDIYFICQKSLITEGNLELFKGIFRGKIVKNEQHFLRIFNKK